MSSQQPTAADADFVKAFKELDRGEKTAAALEKQLSAMEKKIDELLARAEQDQKDLDEKAATTLSKQESTERDTKDN